MVKGKVRAWIGIGLGGLCTLIWGGLIVFFVVAASSR